MRKLWGRGLNGRALLEQHAAGVDSLLQANFLDQAGAGEDYALVALGGYGRRDLFPYSDIDLMILHAEGVDERKIETMAQAIFYPLWDEGFEVGHAVRSVKQCLDDAARDFFLFTSLLDARLIAGSSHLFCRLTGNFSRTLIEGNRERFIDEISKNRDLRHHRFGSHAFLLEPQIKDGRGGFRDINTLFWTARVMFGLSSLEDMSRAGLFTPEEAEGFHHAWDHLVQVRNRLHFLSGRKNDQLFFEHQTAIAADAGFKDHQGRLAVEQFMRHLYRDLQTIATSSELFFEHVKEVVGQKKGEGRSRAIEEGISLNNDRLRFTDPELIERKPQLAVRIFLHASRLKLPIHHLSRKQIGKDLELVRENRHRKRLTAPFCDLVCEGDHQTLSCALDSGMIQAMIPEFGRIESLAQHDIYHLYTVDRHLLACVAELHRLEETEKEIFASLRQPKVLFLAGLLHDIGKGSGREHCQEGEKLATQIGKGLNLSPTEVKALSFLVRNHLFMSHMAQSRDLEDEAFIRDCAERISDPDLLNMLYLLSIADARATGPAAWNDWKAALLQDLYLRITHTLDTKEITGPDLAGASAWMREQIIRELPSGSDFDIDALPEPYLLNFSPRAVARHIEKSLLLSERTAVIIPKNKNSHWSLTIVCRDRTGILARICGCLALNNLRIRAALIHTWDNGTVVDQIEVKPAFAEKFSTWDWTKLEADLNLALKNRIGLEHRLAEKNSGTRIRTPKSGGNKVVVDNSVSAAYTLIEVFSPEIPGLLYSITRAMADFGLSIHRAIISTRSDMMVNVFYVVDESGGKIKDDELVKEVRAGLLFAASRQFFK